MHKSIEPSLAEPNIDSDQQYSGIALAGDEVEMPNHRIIDADAYGDPVVSPEAHVGVIFPANEFGDIHLVDNENHLPTQEDEGIETILPLALGFSRFCRRCRQQHKPRCMELRIAEYSENAVTQQRRRCSGQ